MPSKVHLGFYAITMLVDVVLTGLVCTMQGQSYMNPRQNAK